MNTNALFLDTIVTVFQVAAAIFAILFRNKYFETPLRYLYLILIYSSFNELGAWLYAQYFDYNALLYNIYNTIFFLYFFYVYSQYVARKNHRNWIYIASFLFVLVCIANAIFKNFVQWPQVTAYIVGASFLIFCIILYFIEILTTSKILNVKQHLLFWVSVGLLLFYVGYIPIKITRLYFANKMDLLLTIKTVHILLIIIMNACFILGFIWTTKKK